MKLQHIRTDKINPGYIQAYMKWMDDLIKERDKSVGEETPKYERDIRREIRREMKSEEMRMWRDNKNKDHKSTLHHMKMSAALKQIYSNFLKEYPWYQIDLKDFCSAYMSHPLGWGLMREREQEGDDIGLDIIHNVFRGFFEEICTYDKVKDNL